MEDTAEEVEIREIDIDGEIFEYDPESGIYYSESRDMYFDPESNFFYDQDGVYDSDGKFTEWQGEEEGGEESQVVAVVNPRKEILATVTYCFNSLHRRKKTSPVPTPTSSTFSEREQGK